MGNGYGQGDGYDGYEVEYDPGYGYDAGYDESPGYDYGYGTGRGSQPYDQPYDMGQGTDGNGMSPTPGSDQPNRKKGISNKTKGIITLALVGVYLLWPADIIPDVAVGLGQVDDALVFATGVITILMRLRGNKK